MTETSIIERIRRGHSDAQIKSAFMRQGERLDNFCHLNCYPRFFSSSQPHRRDELLQLLTLAGFSLTRTIDSRLRTRHSEVWAGTCKGFKADLKWDEILIPGGRYTYYLVVTTPDSTEWHLFSAHEVTDLSRFMRLWTAWHEQSKTIDQQIGKLRKQFNIGQATIKAVVHNVVNNSQLTYSLREEKPDTWLHIRLRNHRCLTIEMRPEKDTASLARVPEVIEGVRKALDAVGAVNLTVKGGASELPWQRAEGTADGEQQPTPSH